MEDISPKDNDKETGSGLTIFNQIVNLHVRKLEIGCEKDRENNYYIKPYYQREKECPKKFL